MRDSSGLLRYIIVLCHTCHILCAWCPMTYDNKTDSAKGCVGGLSHKCLHGTCEYAQDSSQIRYETCVCHNGTDWVGKNCDKCCNLTCIHGSCEEDSGELSCVCSGSFGGASCNKSRITTTTTVQPSSIKVAQIEEIVGGSVGAGLVLLIAVTVVVVFILYRKRHKWTYRLLQVFHIIEKKKFDVFVSYCSSGVDEKFVAKTLLPHLEDIMKLKVCIHFRDFNIGEYIADNILWGIQNSQKSLLVLSPDFLKSEWAKYEVVVAHHEMINLKHKIIPFIFRDIGPIKEIENRVIRNILETITFIEWPTDDNLYAVSECWKRLNNVLNSKPHKRVLENNNV